jgi:O-antigen/teichoic acid export membrane protein
MTTFGLRLMGAGLAFALQVLLARLVGQQDYGQFAVVWTWILALGSFASLGLAELALRVVPRYALRLRQKVIHAYFSNGFRSTALAAVIASGAGLMLAVTLPLQSETRAIVIGICLGLPLLALEFFLEGVARAMGWFKLTTIVIYIVRPVLMAAGAVGVWYSGHVLNGMALCLILFVSMAVTTLFLWWKMHQRLAAQAQGKAPGEATRRFWLRQSMPLLLASGLDDVLMYIDVVLVGLWLSPADAALYFVASRVLALASLAQYAFSFVAARRFSMSLASDGEAHALGQMWRVTALATAITVLAVGVTLVACPWLLALFGEGYGNSFSLVAILGVAQVGRALFGQGQEYMLVSGRSGALMVINLLAVLVLLATFWMILPESGVIGAAIGLAAVIWLRAAVLLGWILLSARAVTDFRNVKS